MTSFVEILPEEYDKEAFKRFDASTADFRIANARALMWFSQLAYETHRPETIEAVRTKWDFTSISAFNRGKVAGKGSFETCGIIGERPDAVILAFAGTDPGVWQNLVTDFTPLPREGSDLHRGFRIAAEAARRDIDDAVARGQRTGKPFFVTGHSLGAALAALAAKQASDASQRPRAVYGFGMPRVGGLPFKTDYDAVLGAVTYRLVHGIDMVARVAPSSIGFRHVGRVLQCAAGTKFDETRLSQPGGDEPAFSGQLQNVFTRAFDNVLSGDVLSAKGLGTFGPLFRFLPPEIRDHLQDSYWNALTP